MFYDLYSVFHFYLRLKISILKRHTFNLTTSYIQPSIYLNANIMLGSPVEETLLECTVTRGPDLFFFKGSLV